MDVWVSLGIFLARTRYGMCDSFFFFYTRCVCVCVCVCVCSFISFDLFAACV